jgi:hypothetical protein
MAGRASSSSIRNVVCPQGPALLRRTDSETATNRAEDGAAVTEEVANRVVARVVKAMGGRIPGVTFDIVETFESLPAHIQADATEQEARDAKGVCHGGVVYVVRDAHKTAKDFEKTVFDELHGHVGLNKLYGNGIIQKLDGPVFADCRG